MVKSIVVGDTVRYTGSEIAYLIGKQGLITSISPEYTQNADGTIALTEGSTIRMCVDTGYTWRVEDKDIKRIQI